MKTLAAVLAVLLVAAPRARAQQDSDIVLFKGLANTSLGSVSESEERRQFWTTVNIEKMKVQRKMLSVVYDNAFEAYQRGDYEGAQELAAKVLAMDPANEDAQLLKTAASQLKGAPARAAGERQMIDDRFKAGLSLYEDRRLVEAQRKFEEIVKLNPSNLKARYWLKRIQRELAEEHGARGEDAYRERRLQEALDQWYAALLLYPGYPGLQDRIAKAEAELREEQANKKMEGALQLYSQGRLNEALQSLSEVLQVTPGDSKASRLLAEVKGEIASQHLANGDKLYNARKFTAAMDEWRQAQKFGYDPRLAEARVARAREMMRREDENVKRRAEMAKRRREEAAAAAAEEARRKEEEERKRAEEEAKKKEKPEEAPAKEPAQIKPVDEQTPEQKARAQEENRRNAQQHYLNGVVSFQQKQYDKAKYEWTLCKDLDPSNLDCDSGLRRIDAMLTGQ